MMNIDDAWDNFINNRTNIKETDECLQKNVPKPTDIYISTKTKIAYLDSEIELYNLFWKIPIIKYWENKEGVIKKQMKFSSSSKEQSKEIMDKCEGIDYLSIDTIKYFDNVNMKNAKYKHVMKINVGITKKDMIRFNIIKKGAFYNCFVLIFRIKYKEIFKEIHVKVFNTGKLEIPGVQDNIMLYRVLDLLIETLQPFIPDKKISYNLNGIETVLINSNFNCGYYINRQKLHNILKYYYNINTQYDSCSYPGIQCKFYYNNYNKENDGVCKCIECDDDTNVCSKKGTGNGKYQCKEVSFMIFRTGSVLIVGRCDEEILYIIYDFIKDILMKEYHKIKINNVNIKEKKKEKKKRKKMVLFM